MANVQTTVKASAWWRRLAVLATVSIVAACGQPVLSPMALTGGLPVNLDVDAAAAAGPISVSFNDTYKERVDLNEPLARKNPKNTDKGLFRLINGATESIDGAFYDIGDPGVVTALIKAHERGVKVRLVTDSDNMTEKDDPTKPRAVIVRLKQAGIKIVDDQRSAIMHHKFMVVDDKAVWMGSTNLTPTSLYCHNNNAMIFRSPEMANAFNEEFTRLFVKKQFGISTRGLVPLKAPITVGNAEVRVFFSPMGGGRAAVLGELAKAKKSVHFLTFSLTDVEVGRTLVDKARAGVQVGGIFDRWLAAGQYSLFSQFRTAKLDVLRDGNEALMHHKVIIVDRQTLITGSYNYSQNAEKNNNEAFVIVKGAPAIVNAFEDEYQRLNHAAKVNRPPPYKQKDSEHKTGDEP